MNLKLKALKKSLWVYLIFSHFIFANRFFVIDIYSSSYVNLIYGNKIFVSGNAILEGNIFSNLNAILEGNSVVEGDVSYAGDILRKGNSKIKGEIEKVSSVPLHIIPNKDCLKNISECIIFTKEPYEITKQINEKIFVEGDVIIKGEIKGEGTIIATGDIKLISVKNTYPNKLSLISFKNIKISGDSDFTGICYSAGSINISGNGNFSGSMIADSLNISGNVSFIYKPLLVDILLKQMEEAIKIRNQEIIFKSAETIIKYGNYATPFLIEILTNKDKMWEFRYLITEIMVEIKDPNFVPPLITVLNDTLDNENVREHAAQALGLVKDRRALNALKASLNDVSEIVRSRASLALGIIGDNSVVNALITVLQNKEQYGYYTLINAVKSLGMIKDSSAVPQLIEALQDEDEVLRMQIVYSLGNIQDITTVDSLVFLLQNDKSEYVRSIAAESLGKIGGEKAFNSLIQCLQMENDEFVRIYIAQSLAEIGDDRALQPLRDALEKTNDPFAKQKIIEAIEKLKNE